MAKLIVVVGLPGSGKTHNLCKFKDEYSATMMQDIAKHTKVDMIWVAGRSPTLVSQNLKATTLTYLAIVIRKNH